MSAPAMRFSRWVMPLEMVQFLKAIAEVAADFEEIRRQATSVAPDDARQIDDRLFAVKAEADKGFYPRATLECRLLKDEVGRLAANLPALQAELESRWSALSAALPGALGNVDRKLARGITTGMSRRWLEAVRTKHQNAHAEWDHACSAARSQRWSEAVTRGEKALRSARELAEELRGF